MSKEYQCLTTMQHDNVTIASPDESRFQAEHKSPSQSMFLMKLRNELIELVESAEPPLRLVLNMQHVERGTSELLSITVKVRERVMHHGGRLAICGLNDWMRSVYSATFPKGQVFKICDTEEEAIAALA